MKTKLLAIGLGLWFLQACSTTGQVARIDKEKRRFELQSQDDSKSAMATNDDKGNQALVAKLERRVEEQPRDIESLINLAQAHLAMGKYDKAEAVCRNALRVDLKNELARKILAQIHYRRGNLEMAQIILNGIDSANSKDSEVLNLLGMIALRQDKPDFALQSFREALKHNPGDLAVRMNLGVLYVHYRQLGLAAIEFERILKVMPEHPDANMNLAIIETNRGNLDKAEDLYKKVLGVSKNNPVAIYNLAIVEEKRKNFDKSLSYLKTYLDSDYAKKKNNQEVFALIDKIRLEKEALTGERVSDKEIMSLAAKANKQGNIRNTGDKEFVDAEPRHEDEAAQTARNKAAAQAAPVKEAKATPAQTRASEAKAEPKAEPKKKYKKGQDESIDDLEKQLQ